MSCHVHMLILLKKHSGVLQSDVNKNKNGGGMIMKGLY